ncbi:MAG: hypothetical protein KGL42_15970 [Betaproteobacteria bacterium]|nr:hypothetical protein [Betaproteobacteria bacterium]
MAALDAFAAPSTCRISVHALHRSRTVAVREHSASKTPLSSRAPRVFGAGDAASYPDGDLRANRGEDGRWR